MGLGVLGLAGCVGAQESAAVPFQRSEAALAAEGDVLADRVDGNTRVSVQVAFLAPPERVSPGATVYVVWVRPLTAQGDPQNLGVIRLGEDRRGRLESSTPHAEFEVVVTAEPTGTVLRPSGKVVLRARINESD